HTRSDRDWSSDVCSSDLVDQAMTILSAGHDIKCMFTTPKLLDALCKRLEEKGSSIAKQGITGIFCGGTEMTSQWIRFMIEEYLRSEERRVGKECRMRVSA